MRSPLSSSGSSNLHFVRSLDHESPAVPLNNKRQPELNEHYKSLSNKSHSALQLLSNQACFNQIIHVFIKTSSHLSRFNHTFFSSLFLISLLNKFKSLCAAAWGAALRQTGSQGTSLQRSSTLQWKVPSLLWYWLTDSDGQLLLALDPEDANKHL